MRAKVAFIFLVGFSVGYIITHLLTENSAHSKQFKQSHGLVVRQSDEDVMKYRKIRILCFIGTSTNNFATKVVHIRKTWGKNCDKIIFASNKSDPQLGVIGFNGPDDRSHFFKKLVNLMSYIRWNFIDEYDW